MASHKFPKGLAILGHMSERRYRQVLVDNLEWLLKQKEMKATELARRAGLPQRTVSHIMDREGPNTRLDKLEPIAQVFGLKNSGQLLDPDLPKRYPIRDEINALADLYVRSGKDGRDTIKRVAESMSRYDETG